VPTGSLIRRIRKSVWEHQEKSRIPSCGKDRRRRRVFVCAKGACRPMERSRRGGQIKSSTPAKGRETHYKGSKPDGQCWLSTVRERRDRLWEGKGDLCGGRAEVVFDKRSHWGTWSPKRRTGVVKPNSWRVLEVELKGNARNLYRRCHGPNRRGKRPLQEKNTPLSKRTRFSRTGVEDIASAGGEKPS